MNVDALKSVLLWWWWWSWSFSGSDHIHDARTVESSFSSPIWPDLACLDQAETHPWSMTNLAELQFFFFLNSKHESRSLRLWVERIDRGWTYIRSISSLFIFLGCSIIWSAREGRRRVDQGAFATPSVVPEWASTLAWGCGWWMSWKSWEGMKVADPWAFPSQLVIAHEGLAWWCSNRYAATVGEPRQPQVALQTASRHLCTSYKPIPMGLEETHGQLLAPRSCGVSFKPLSAGFDRFSNVKS